MHNLVRLETVAIAAVAILGAGALAWVWSYSFEPCAIEPVSEDLKLALGHYSQTIQQLLNLSTAVAALGAAVLLGLQTGVRLSHGRSVLVLSSTICFVLCAYFTLLWQSRLGQSLLQGCPQLVTEKFMVVPFNAAAYSFVAGLALIGLVVGLSAYQRDSKLERDDENSTG